MAMLSLMATVIPGAAQDLEWAGATGGLGDDVAQALTVDMDGNVLVAGQFEDAVDMDPGPGQDLRTAVGQNDIYIQKLTSDGALIWALTIGGAGSDYATGISTDALGNVYVTGAFNETVDFDPGPLENTITSAGDYDIFLAKFTADGDLLWVNGMGGADYDESTAVTVGPSGGVYLLSYFNGTIDADPGAGELLYLSQGGLDILLQKFNEQGELQWAQATGGSGTDLGQAIALDADENIWMTGAFRNTVDFDPGPEETILNSAGAWDIFVTKRSADGTYLWAGRMGGVENFDLGYDIAADPDGNVVVVGAFFGSGDFDPGPGVHTLTASSLGSDEIFVVKLDAAGEFLWAKSIGGENADLAYGVRIADDGRIHLTGFFSGTADFDPDPIGSFELSTTSVENFFDAFLCTLGPDGAFLGAWQFGGANSIGTQSIVLGAGDELYLAGHFENTVDLDPGAGDAMWSNAGFRDAFVIRIGVLPTGVPSSGTVKAPHVFPNPGKDHVMIDVRPELIGAMYMVSDELGRVVAQGRLGTAPHRLSLDGMAVGKYQLHVLRSGVPSAVFMVLR